MTESLRLANYGRLEAEIDGQIVTHRGYRSNPETGERRVRSKESWRRGPFLGHGASGTVMLEENVMDKSRVRAVKILAKHRETSAFTDPFNEAAVMALLSNAQNSALFVNFGGWYETHDSFCLVMEYIKYGDLEHHLYVHGALEEPDVSDIVKQLLEGLAVIHHAGFIHRDLKPSNILIQHPSPWWVKIGDFGISKRLIDESTITLTGSGTRGYKAPEVSFNERTHHTTAVDMWSLGCITYKALVNQMPFANDYDISYFRHNTLSFSLKLDTFKLLSSEAKTFLKSLLVIEPQQRATVDAALEHAWIINPPQRLDWETRPQATAGYQPSTTLFIDQHHGDDSQKGNRDNPGTSHSISQTSSRDHDRLQPPYQSNAERARAQPLKMALNAMLLRRKEYFPHDDEEALRHFVRANDVEVVSLLLDQDARVNARYESNFTPLMYAATLGHAEMVQLLLDRGGDLDAMDRAGYTSFLMAVQHNHPQVVRKLPVCDTELDSKDENGYPLLIRAATDGHRQLVRSLIEKGFDVEVRDEVDRTPLMWASSQGHHQVVRLLLERGADVNSRDRHGKTPFMYIYAKMHQHCRQASRLDSIDKSNSETETMEILLEGGADFDARDNAGSTALLSGIECSLECYYPSSNAFLEANEGIKLQLDRCQETHVRLLNKGVSVNLEDRNGQTPLMLIAQHQQRYLNGTYPMEKLLMELLLDRGADTNAIAADGSTALIYAAQKNSDFISRLLLERGANVNMKNHKGQTALMNAAQQGFESVCRLLLERGADINLKNDDGHSALTLAASSYNLWHVCSLLLDQGAEIEVKDNKGQTALIIASRNGHQNMCFPLLNRGADVHAKDRFGWTALMHAIYGHASPDICQRLVAEGARVNLQDRNGLSPLMLATQAGLGSERPFSKTYRDSWVRNLVRLLIQGGARLDLRNRTNKTAYDIAKELDYFSRQPLATVLEHLLPPPPPQSSASEKLKYKLHRLKLRDL